MNANAMPVLENKMVERAYPLRRIVTEYARIIIAFRNRTIDHPVYGQDIAAKKTGADFRSPREYTILRNQIAQKRTEFMEVIK